MKPGKTLLPICAAELEFHGDARPDSSAEPVGKIHHGGDLGPFQVEGPPGSESVSVYARVVCV